MMRHDRGFLLVVLLLSLGMRGAAAQAQRPEQVQSDISTREISIQSNFTGIEIVLFGSIDFSRAPSLEEGPYDVIMTIRGPNRPIVVRKKERIAGVWMNGPSKTFPTVPGFYAVLASRPFRAIAPESTLQKLGIGFSSLDFGKTVDGEPAGDGFRANLIRLQQEHDLFQESDDAVGFIVDTCRAEEGLWLVPTGPLTNIALAMRAAPDLSERVAGVSLMGGGSFGNRSAVAEFNIWADPEAAAMVFASGVPLVMAGLDVTHQFLVDDSRIADVEAIGGQLAAVLAGLFRFFAGTYTRRHEHMVGAALHDPLAVLALTHRGLFTSSERHVAVETRGELTRGMTVIDRRDLKERPAPNCTVLETVDADAAWQLIVDAIVQASA